MPTLLCDLCPGDKNAPVLRERRRGSVTHLGKVRKSLQGRRMARGQGASLLLLFLQTFPAAPNIPRIQIFCGGLVQYMLQPSVVAKCVEGQESHLGTGRKQGENRKKPKTIRSLPPPTRDLLPQGAPTFYSTQIVSPTGGQLSQSEPLGDHFIPKPYQTSILCFQEEGLINAG